jgi:hypothetical protein
MTKRMSLIYIIPIKYYTFRHEIAVRHLAVLHIVNMLVWMQKRNKKNDQHANCRPWPKGLLINAP